LIRLQPFPCPCLCPCPDETDPTPSVHDPDAAREFGERLKRVADATREQLIVVMRTYFEKPRTTVGWKGLINDPQLDGSGDITPPRWSPMSASRVRS